MELALAQARAAVASGQTPFGAVVVDTSGAGHRRGPQHRARDAGPDGCREAPRL